MSLSRVVIAVVVEEDDFAADVGLEPARDLKLGDEKPFWEKPAGLLAETDDRGRTQVFAGACQGS